MRSGFGELWIPATLGLSFPHEKVFPFPVLVLVLIPFPVLVPVLVLVLVLVPVPVLVPPPFPSGFSSCVFDDESADAVIEPEHSPVAKKSPRLPAGKCSLEGNLSLSR